MKHLSKTTAIIMIVTMVGSVAFAQCGPDGGRPQKRVDHRQDEGPGRPGGPGGPGGQRPGADRFVEAMLKPEVAEEIGLNDAQIEALRMGMEQIKQEESALIKKLQTAGKAQAKLLSSKGDVDEDALMKAVERTGRIRTQMAKLRVQSLLLVKKTLTEEQIEKSKRLMHRRMAKQRGDWSNKQARRDGDWRSRRERPRQWNREDEPEANVEE